MTARAPTPPPKRTTATSSCLLNTRTVPKADSGIYLRGCPQVQIWDYTEKEKFPARLRQRFPAAFGITAPARPAKTLLVLADKPFGQWNKVRVLMAGARVSVLAQ